MLRVNVAAALGWAHLADGLSESAWLSVALVLRAQPYQVLVVG